MALLERNELILLGLLVILGFTWAGLLNPFLQGQEWFIGLEPIFAYPIYNFGIFLLITAFFGVPSAILIRRRLEINFLDILIGGFVSFIAFSFVVDVWMPPLAWDIGGNQLIPTNSNLENTAGDYFFGWLWLELGFPKILTYWMVYFLVPILTFFTIILIYGQKEVIFWFGRLL